jgi:hypothetical protein
VTAPWGICCLLVVSCAKPIVTPPVVTVKEVELTRWQSEPHHGRFGVELLLETRSGTPVEVTRIELQLTAPGWPAVAMHHDAFTVPGNDSIDVWLDGQADLPARTMKLLHGGEEPNRWTVDGKLWLGNLERSFHEVRSGNSYGLVSDCLGTPDSLLPRPSGCVSTSDLEFPLMWGAGALDP